MAFYGLMMWVLLAGLSCTLVEGLGVNWGTIATHQLKPKTVAQLLMDNNITKVKLFDVEESCMSALAGTGIEVMITIPNSMLERMNNYGAAKKWVKQNVTRYNTNGVNIKYVAVGNEPFLTFYNNTLTNVTFPALQNIQSALNEAGVGDTIKATIPLNADVYESPIYNNVPSAGGFRSNVSDQMTQIVKFLNQSGAPFIVNIYPFLCLYGNPNFPVDFAYFDGTSHPLIDGSLQYNNVFEANFDTLVSALKQVGVGDMPIVIGEIGWPTDGDVNANVSNAEKFYNGLLKSLNSKQGTPLRPNTSIEVFLFSLFDEDGKSVLPGNFERHWGIFTNDGKPKFPMDLFGQNRSLVAAKEVEYLPRRWCVFDPNTAANLSKLEDNVYYACDRADCSAITNGSSCDGLDANGRASYAFNMYFQTQNQQNASCHFDGLAMVTTQDYSKGDCKFIVQLAHPPPPAPPPHSPAIPPRPSPAPTRLPGVPSRSSAAPGWSPGVPPHSSDETVVLPSFTLLVALISPFLLQLMWL